MVDLNPNGIAVMLGNGDGTFQAPVTYATDDLPGGLTVADLNGDGVPDIVAIGKTQRDDVPRGEEASAVRIENGVLDMDRRTSTATTGTAWYSWKSLNASGVVSAGDVSCPFFPRLP